MIRVVSYQISGVAWVPGRIAKILEGSDKVEFIALEAGLTEDYGLRSARVQSVGRSGTPWRHALDRDADVFHIHHDRVAATVLHEMKQVLANRLPKFKTVVSIHGEPDRRLNNLLSDCDAFHMVNPGLLDLKSRHDIPRTVILNHPGWDPDEEIMPIAKREKVLVVPASKVAGYKNHDVMSKVAAILEKRGWKIEQNPAIVPNYMILNQLRTARACWVQLQGYIDLLTMECRALGCVPVVHDPLVHDPLGVTFNPLHSPETLADILCDDCLMKFYAVFGKERARQRRTPDVRTEWENFYAEVVR